MFQKWSAVRKVKPQNIVFSHIMFLKSSRKKARSFFFYVRLTVVSGGTTVRRHKTG